MRSALTENWQHPKDSYRNRSGFCKGRMQEGFMRKWWVLALSFFLGGFVCLSLFLYFVIWPRLNERNTATLIAVIDEAIATCHIETGWNPSTETALLPDVLFGNNVRQKTYLDPRLRAFLNEKGEFVDDWNVPLKCVQLGEGTWYLRSAGRNGSFGDSDDLTAEDFFHEN